MTSHTHTHTHSHLLCVYPVSQYHITSLCNYIHSSHTHRNGPQRSVCAEMSSSSSDILGVCVCVSVCGLRMWAGNRRCFKFQHLYGEHVVWFSSLSASEYLVFCQFTALLDHLRWIRSVLKMWSSVFHNLFIKGCFVLLRGCDMFSAVVYLISHLQLVHMMLSVFRLKQ